MVVITITLHFTTNLIKSQITNLSEVLFIYPVLKQLKQVEFITELKLKRPKRHTKYLVYLTLYS